MFTDIIRKYVGGLRLFLTICVLSIGATVVLLDVVFDKNVSSQVYVFLGGIFAQATVFQVVETVKKTKNENS